MKFLKNSNYDLLFKHNIQNHIEDIIIYTTENRWSINQNYNNVLSEEHLIWSRLYKTTYEKAYNYGDNIYKKGIDIFNRTNSDFRFNIPNLNEISLIINNATSWKIKPVAGFVNEIIFFKLISECYFPSSDVIRLSTKFKNKYKGLNIKNNLSYTPEPDIFHEIFGHTPFLLNNKYCKLFQDIGRLGCEILNSMEYSDDLKYHNLRRLQNFVWWTLEFGLISKDINNDFKIFGAGILSSIDEINNVVKSIKNIKKYSKIIKYDIEKIALTCFDYSNLQDRYYYIDSFNNLYDSFYSNKDIFLYKGN